MRKIHYAVVGLGDIAQEAVLPAFSETRSSELTALVSGDLTKREELSKKYKLSRTYSYAQLEECLNSGEVDAVYVATPNHLHREYVERAARKGIHVLCEKPMAPTRTDCEAMIQAAREHSVKLMIAYRLHFERATLEAIEIAQKKLGDLRIFSSVFSQQVKPGNIRVTVPEQLGGGSVWDMGVYCINAARYFFQAEPYEVAAFSSNSDSKRFGSVDEMTTAMLRFPGDRLAVFASSFGAASTDSIILVGSDGRLEIEPAFGYTDSMVHRLTVDGKTSEKKYPQTQHFAAEIDYFSQCILEGTEPEPSGEEGLADVRIIEAIYRSATNGRPETLEPFSRDQRPAPDQRIDRKPKYEENTVHASSPGISE